jgi:hypothetical protein
MPMSYIFEKLKQGIIAVKKQILVPERRKKYEKHYDGL